MESEDSKDSGNDAPDREKVSDESNGDHAQGTWKNECDDDKKVEEVADEDSKDCEVIIDISEDEVDAKRIGEVEELDESEVKDLNFSWAPQSNLDRYERQGRIAEKIKKLVDEEIEQLVDEETIKSSVEIVEESVVIEDEEGDVAEENAAVISEHEEASVVIDEKSKISTIDLDASVEEKPVPQ